MVDIFSLISTTTACDFSCIRGSEVPCDDFWIKHLGALDLLIFRIGLETSKKIVANKPASCIQTILYVHTYRRCHVERL